MTLSPKLLSLLDSDRLKIGTQRMTLEPVTESHAEELWELLQDPELNHFIPHEVPTMKEARDRCTKWEKRRSPDGAEVWLNWVGRERATGKIVAHYQAGFKNPMVATIGYVVGSQFQRRGFAFEGLNAMFELLREKFSVQEIKAWSDTRNEASHNLAKKLGMVQVEFIKNADFFNGATSDEFVFSKVFS